MSIEECIDRAKCAIKSLEIPVRMACEQEEHIEEEVCDKLSPELPELYRVHESVHKDEVQLETPKINVVEISALPREIKSEMPLEQSESKLVQDVNTSVHTELSLPNGTIDLCKISLFEVSVPNRNVLGISIPKFHTKQRKVLGSKLFRRAKPTKMVKSKIPSICRPPPKPPDRQNRLNVKVSKRILSKVHAKKDRGNYRPPPKLPYILNVKGEVIGIIENENLPYIVPKSKPPPEPPPKGFIIYSWYQGKTKFCHRTLLYTKLNKEN